MHSAKEEQAAFLEVDHLGQIEWIIIFSRGWIAFLGTPVACQGTNRFFAGCIWYKKNSNSFHEFHELVNDF